MRKDITISLPRCSKRFKGNGRVLWSAIAAETIWFMKNSMVLMNIFGAGDASFAGRSSIR
jgi:hypothetical protein